MKFEQSTGPESENAPDENLEGKENFENYIEARSRTASLFLAGLMDEKCAENNFERIAETVNKTEIINIREEISKNSEHGVAYFQSGAWSGEAGGKNHVEISTVLFRSLDSEENLPHYSSARLVMRQKENVDADIAVYLSSDLQNVADNSLIGAEALNESDDAIRARYLMFIKTLNTSLEILQTLKLVGKDETPEAYAIRSKITEFTDILDEEYAGKYNQVLVKKILQN